MEKEFRGRKRLDPSEVKKPVTIYIKQFGIDAVGGMDELKIALEKYVADLIIIKSNQ
jgi:hypothetical protein